MCFDDRVSGVLETVSGLLHRQERKPEKPGTPTCMCCMCRTPRPVDANQMDPPVPNPKFGTYISRGIPATRLLGRTPKAPPATQLPSIGGQFWSRFFGGIVLPTFRTDSSKRRNAPGGRRRARGWWRRCGRSWLLLRVRGCTTQHKTEWAIQKNGEERGTAERA